MKTIKNTILECIGVAVAGVIFGLVANSLYGHGVHLGRDYFPKGKVDGPITKPKPTTTQNPTSSQPSANPGAGEESHDPVLQKAIEDILNDGLQPIPHDEVALLYRDPLYQGGSYVFVDARNTSSYQAGHIPGAYQLDHYHIEDYIDGVIRVCQDAFKVVVYCNGGECEDSRFAAIELVNRGIDPTRVYVYPGGIEAWHEANLPVERGEHNSGDIVAGKALPEGGHE